MAQLKHHAFGTHITIDENQENARLKAKNAVKNATHLQPTRRPALNDLGNKFSNNVDLAGKTKMGAPDAIPKKKVDLPKNNTRTAHNKENANSNVDAKQVTKKIIRQESLVLPKCVPQQEIKKSPKLGQSKQATNEKCKELAILDPDKDHRNDPQLVTEYVSDIMAYLRGIEDMFPIKEKFLTDLKITPKMRATLVNWLVEVNLQFKSTQEALYLAVSISDRYLMDNKFVDRKIYQLVGTVSLLLASKYEEVCMPDLEDFVYICDDAFTKKQILQMEKDILRKLDFRMGWPIPIYFLRRYSKIAKVKEDHYTLAKYILELGLLEYEMAHVKPSIQAAAACCLSIAVLNEIMDPSRVWTPTLVRYTTYKYSDFSATLVLFAKFLKNAQTSKFDAVKQKYSTSKFGKISSNFKLQGPLMRKLTLP